MDLAHALEHLARPRVLILGDLILDRYVAGAVERISPEAPIPVLAATRDEERLGGAGNVAVNLRSMEAEVEVFGVLALMLLPRAIGILSATKGHGMPGFLGIPTMPIAWSEADEAWVRGDWVGWQEPYIPVWLSWLALLGFGLRLFGVA